MTEQPKPAENLDSEQPSNLGASADRNLVVIRNALVGIFLLLLIIATYFARDVLLPIILALLLALTLRPMVRGMGKWGVPPPATALALIVLAGLGIAGGAYSISGPITDWVEEAPELAAELRWKISSLSNSVEAVKEASDQVEQITDETTDPSVQKVAIETPGFIGAAMTNATTVVSTVMIALVLAFFLLGSGDLFYTKLIESFPNFRDKKRALRIAYGIEKSVSRYLLTVTLVNACLGLVVGFSLWLIGLPQPIVWGILAFVLNFLPYVGAIVGTVLVGVVSIVNFDSLSYGLIAPAAYLAATAVEGQFVTPMILGRRLELNTVSVFVTVVFWAWLWGIAGALMAVPFLVCVKVLCDNIEQFQVVGNFLSAAEPRPAVPTSEVSPNQVS